MYPLSEIRNLIKNKLAEASDDFFTSDVINSQINIVLGEIASETLCYYDVRKFKVPDDTDGINVPGGCIDVVDFYVNNQRYTRISFGEISQYIGDDAVYPNDFVYYTRNEKLITLAGLKKDDELTIYFNSYFEPLIDIDDTLPTQFDNPSFIQIIVYGVCWKLKEMDESLKEAAYFRDIYMFELQNLKKKGLSRKRGHMRWKLQKADMNSPLILSGGKIINRDTNRNDF